MNVNSSVRFGFSPEPSAPGAARRAVGAALRDWNLSELAPLVELLVSEVVTNAVRHARSDGELEISLADRTLRVEVSDRVAGSPTPRHPAPDAPSGRGLAIVEAVASRWGVGPLDGVGKTVWFELDIDEMQIEV